MDGIISAGIRLVMLEAEYGRVSGLTNFTKEYARKHIEPVWLRIVAAREDLKKAVEGLRS